MKRVAIIGAGLSGLVVARHLRDAAHISLFEKSRGVGGRMATRYANGYEFDHGAQFFTARTAAFREFLQPLVDNRVVTNWTVRFAELDRERVRDIRSWGKDYPHYVGAPRMNAVGKFLSQGLDMRTSTRIVEARRDNARWALLDSDGNAHDGFDWLVLTAPAPQTAVLASGIPALLELSQARDMRACFALMLGFAEALELPWQAAVVRDADISWISVNSSKPERGDSFAMVIHSTNAWADRHVDEDPEYIRSHMIDEASGVCGVDLRLADHCSLHRWRYANIDKQSGPDNFVDIDAQLGACGDWFVRGRVEAAFTSAHSLARQLRHCL